VSLRDTAAYYHVVLERFPPRPVPAFEDPAMLVATAVPGGAVLTVTRVLARTALEATA